MGTEWAQEGMTYQNPRPKVEMVKAGVRLPPETLALIDRSCGVLGLSRESWIRGLIQGHLVVLGKEADAWVRRCKGGGRNGPVSASRGRDNVAAWQTTSQKARKDRRTRR